MGKRKESVPRTSEPVSLRPALTPEGREDRCIALAFDLVEQRLIDGSASSQETTHFLKLGTEKYKYETQKLAGEVKLTDAKTDMIASSTNMEQLVKDAIKVMTEYQGREPEESEEEDYDDEY
nr:MAG TPA: hypothetical protein [Caudoviricetes sp.]